MSGANLLGATAVLFGDTAGHSIVINPSGTSLTVVSPAEPIGAMDITVTTPAGVSPISAVDVFNVKLSDVTECSTTTTLPSGYIVTDVVATPPNCGIYKGWTLGLPSNGETVCGLGAVPTGYIITQLPTDANCDGTTGEQLELIAVPFPGTPTNISALAGDAQASVSFSTPTSNGGSPIISYRVTDSDLSNATNGGQSVVGSGSPIAVTGLTNGDSYTFTVAATNSNGTGATSSASSVVIPSTIPGTPTNISALAGDAQASVSFLYPDLKWWKSDHLLQGHGFRFE